jgi:hypothetical protein
MWNWGMNNIVMQLHLNLDFIELNWMQILKLNSNTLNRIWINFYSTKFNFNSIAFNSTSRSWFNWKILRYTLLKKIFKRSLAYGIRQEKLLKDTSPKYTSPCLFNWEGAKQISLWYCSIYDDDNNFWNFELSYLQQLWWILSLEFELMNHCH